MSDARRRDVRVEDPRVGPQRDRRRSAVSAAEPWIPIAAVAGALLVAIVIGGAAWVLAGVIVVGLVAGHL